MIENVLTNARIVLVDEVITGSLVVRDGRIDDISEGASHLRGARDLSRDYLMPGLVDLHTDNLEKHMMPRPGAPWPPLAAVLAHDAQMATAGITTVLNALSVGDIAEDSDRVRRLDDMVTSLTAAVEVGGLRADHFLHLRCEVAFPSLRERLDDLRDHPFVRMFSIMDHTPGQGQFASRQAFYAFYQGKYGFNEAEMEEFAETCKRNQRRHADEHRKFVVSVAKARNFVLASHDDATPTNVKDAAADGVAIAEFPTSSKVAAACRAFGLRVMVGGPNLVRGGSHAGNISAAELAELGYLDIICSDYVPHSLLHAATLLPRMFEDYDLPRALRSVSKAPADLVGLTDRGDIAIGKRADLIQVGRDLEVPLVRGVWREGRRVA
jgi:alpha-D-ribose 1-methylphosphonate 5-triphosphate diphosphatase